MSANPEEKRRFPRVHFRRDFGASDRITKAFTHWRNHEVTDVFDLSLGGFATSRPGMLELSVGQEFDLTLELGALPALPVKAKMVWIRDFSVGFSFLHLEPEGHLILRKFLSDKLVGSHLRRMNPDLRPENADYDEWYSGPRETHLFLTLDKEGEPPHFVKKAEVMIDGDRMVFEDDRFVSGESLKESLVQILSHAPEEEVVLLNFLDQLLKASEK